MARTRTNMENVFIAEKKEKYFMALHFAKKNRDIEPDSQQSKEQILIRQEQSVIPWVHRLLIQ